MRFFNGDNFMDCAKTRCWSTRQHTHTHTHVRTQQSGGEAHAAHEWEDPESYPYREPSCAASCLTMTMTSTSAGGTTTLVQMKLSSVASFLPWERKPIETENYVEQLSHCFYCLVFFFILLFAQSFFPDRDGRLNKFSTHVRHMEMQISFFFLTTLKCEPTPKPLYILHSTLRKAVNHHGTSLGSRVCQDRLGV